MLKILLDHITPKVFFCVIYQTVPSGSVCMFVMLVLSPWVYVERDKIAALRLETLYRLWLVRWALVP